MSLKIKSDVLKIQHAPVDINGTPIEPEQQMVTRIITTDVEASMQSGQHVGHIPGQIVAEMSAQEAAITFRSKCFQCKHFSTDDFKNYRRACEFSTNKEKRLEINAIRAALLDTGNAKIVEQSMGEDGGIDVEHALSLMGICRPLTEMDGESAIIVHPLGTCPNEVVTAASPQGLFTPKDRDLERLGTSNYDMILNKAAGRQL